VLPSDVTFGGHRCSCNLKVFLARLELNDHYPAQLAAEQVQLLAQQHELAKHRAECLTVVTEEMYLSRAKTPRAVLPWETMTVSIDAGPVRAARGHQGRTFEVLAAQVSNDDGKSGLFSGVPGDADRQRKQQNGVLTDLGMTADTEVTILSDGADGTRSLGEGASTGTVYHVLNWFHLAMRIQHAAQCAGG
jgi:hypothetical protein